ncbi:hypothetical protein [Gimesia panareensis]|uniref:hypothetical protein n=1 Tax=Gimesia panareensis TaxID=2527978 RepID=UPI001188F7A1|nr:hypothetical protein [Gimesia panareensis]QDU52941.1 ATP-dependent zinc metalloprotease FtsH [Gimesia panareensis]
MQQKQEAIAYHEASHAVVGTEYGKRVVLLTIEPGEGYLGHCKTQGMLDWDELQEAKLSFDSNSGRPERNWTLEKRLKRIRRTLTIIVAGSYCNHLMDESVEKVSDMVTEAKLSMHHGVSELTYDDLQKLSDIDVAIKLALQMNGIEIDLIREAEAKADQILKMNWYMVERVANALLRHKTLEGYLLKTVLKPGRRSWE